MRGTTKTGDGATTGGFDLQVFLNSAGTARKVATYLRGAPIFMQGTPCEHVMYIQKGDVKLSVLSKAGRGAVVAMLSDEDFFGEGCLAGQSVHTGSAYAMTNCTILLVHRDAMVRLLRQEQALSARFISHVLTRNMRMEENLVDQLFNSSEKRLARVLLQLARYGKHDVPLRTVPIVSQETLAEMVGTTRSRVNFFMRKFQRLGFIDYSGGLKINRSLLTVLLDD